MSELFAALGAALSQHRDASHELEVRTSLDARGFERMYAAACAELGDDAAALPHLAYEARVAFTHADGRRYSYDARTRALVAVDVKRVLSKRDFYVAGRRVRLAVSSEAPCAAEPSGIDEHRDGHRREKERISFTLPWAPSWRLDFTRARNAGETQHEVEFELLRAPGAADPLAQFRRLAALVELLPRN